ncbi:MAG: hypothetical protein H6563_02670 [Lewinellaceae bacterium]|nr:hypothetical protein [Lewinellaceae bacterium]
MKRYFPFPMLLSLSILLVGSGCISKKAIGFVTLQNNDPNQRSTVSDAHFNRKFSPVAISAMGIGAGVGGYLGYNSNLTSYYKDGVETTFQPANAAIGAVAGFGVTYLANSAILGKKTQVYLASRDDAYKWLRKKRWNHYRIIDFGNSYSNFRIIAEDRESSFQFGNRQDFSDFYNAFGMNSLYFDGNVRNSTQRLSWDDLYWLYQEKARNQLSSLTVTAIEDALLSKAYSIAQHGKTAQAVSRLKEEARKRAFNKARTINEYRDFASYFPEWRADATQRAFELIASAYDVENFINGFPEKQVDALKKAIHLSLSQDQQNHLAEFTGQHNQNLPAYDTKSFYFFLPAYSFGIVTINDVITSNPVEISVSDVEGFWLTNPDFTNFSVYESLLSVIDPSSSPRLLEISVTNTGSKRLAVCLHPVKNDLSRRILQQSWDDVALEVIPEDWTFTRGAIKLFSWGKDLYDYFNQSPEQKIKSGIVKSLAYLMKERYELDGWENITIDVLSDYLIDFVEHVHIL